MQPNDGLDDHRALDILTTEHWSLLSSRSLGYQEMFGRTTIFVAVLSATVVALALLAQATHVGREVLSVGMFLMLVDLFIGITTFARSIAINLEDTRWVEGMSRIRGAYLRMVPQLESIFVAPHSRGAGDEALAHGSRQSPSNLTASLSTTSSVVATLDSVLAGALAADASALAGLPLAVSVLIGAALSVVSGVLHTRFAAGFRERHAI